MYRTALRSASRPAVSGLRSAAVRAAPRRFASTASPEKSRSWKSAAARWGLAIAAVYYYNTSSVFSDEAPPLAASAPYAENDILTVDSLIEKKRKQASAKPVEPVEKKSAVPVEEKSAESTKPDNKPNNKPETQPETQPQSAATSEGSPEALEQEAGQEGAFNPETGEINWDCPCLGGMAHGPCGEEFKTAFSCFVYSTEEPKGMECIDKFQGMQECFRQYPDIYGAELDDTESDEPAPENSTEPPVAEYQKLRDEQPISIEQKSAAETDNLPGVKPVESATPTKLEEKTAANGEIVNEENK